MPISSRGEIGVGGGSRGAGGGGSAAARRARSNSAAAAKAVAPKKPKPLSPVKVLEPIKRSGPVKINTNPSTVVVKPIKIKSGGDIKSAASSKRKLMSYNQLKDMPNLIKIDSAKGNSLKKTAYRPNRRTSN